MNRITALPTTSGPRRQPGAAGNRALSAVAPAKVNGAAEPPRRAIGRLVAWCEQPSGAAAVTTVGALSTDQSGTATADMGALLDDHCRELARAYGWPGGPSLGCSAAACRLPISQAITLGLIVDLLVCDAYVQGFPPGEDGRIAVSLVGLEAVFELTIEDSGRVHSKATQGRALGVDLVRRLVGELGGWLETPEVVGGSRYIVTVPRQKNRRSS